MQDAQNSRPCWASSTKPAIFGAPTLAQAGVALGVPAATAAAGAYVGKKFGHPIAGALTGAGVGALGCMVPFYGGLGIPLLPGLALPAGLHVAMGAGLYGLGRLHGKVWGSKPGGIFKTILRGCLAPVSVPLGMVMN